MLVGIKDFIGVAGYESFTGTADPAASVPIGTTPQGLPIGLQVIGRRGADAQVLAACAHLEAAGLAARPRPGLEHETLSAA